MYAWQRYSITKINQEKNLVRVLLEAPKIVVNINKRNPCGEWAISPMQKLNAFVDCYKDLFWSEVVYPKRFEDFFWLLDFSIITPDQQEGLEASIQVQEVIMAIDKLKLGKAPSPDGFTSEFYKTFKFIFAPRLQKVFSSAVNLKLIMASWSELFLS